MAVNHRRVSISILSSLFLELINKISPLLILHHAQKTLGLPDFGWAQYQIAFFEVMQPLVAYGYTNFALAEASLRQHEEGELRSIFSHIGVLKFLHACAVAFGYAAYLVSVNRSVEPFGLLLFSLLLLATLSDAYWFSIAHHKLAKFSFFSGILRFIGLVLILVGIQQASDRKLFVFLSIFPNTLISLGTGYYAYRVLGFAPIIREKLKRMFWGATPFALIIFSITFFDRIDIFLMERWFGLELAGLYVGPAKVVQSLVALISALAVPFYAETLKVQDSESLSKHISLSLGFLSALTAPVIFGLPFIESDVLPYIFSNLNHSADRLMSTLSLGMMGSVLSSVFGLQVLMAKARPWALMKAIPLAVLTVLVMSWAGKGQLGFWAVAFGMVAGKWVLGLLCLYFSWDLFEHVPLKSCVKPLLAGVVMALGLKLLGHQNWIFMVACGGILYVLTLGFFYRRDLRQILKHPAARKFWPFS